MASAANVFPSGEESFPRSLFGRPTRKAYRAAVAQVIREVKARERLTNEALADMIGCHKDTVENAENEVGSLDPVTLLSIAYAYGEASIAPVRELYLCAPPLDRPSREERYRRVYAELGALEREETR